MAITNAAFLFDFNSTPCTGFSVDTGVFPIDGVGNESPEGNVAALFVVIFIVITNTVLLFELYSTFCDIFSADNQMKGTTNKTQEYDELMRFHCPSSLLCYRSFWVLRRYSLFRLFWGNHGVSSVRVGANGSFLEDADAF